jgi:RHS repeat-associated protein
MDRIATFFARYRGWQFCLHFYRVLSFLILLTFIIPLPPATGVTAAADLQATPPSEETPIPVEPTPTATIPAADEPPIVTPVITDTLPTGEPYPAPPEATPTAAVTLPPPTLTPPPTETPMPTSIPSPTAAMTVTSPVILPQSVSLALSADSEQATPGGIVSLYWQVSGGRLDQRDQSMAVVATPGLTPYSNEEMVYDAKSNAYLLPIKSDSGTTLWQIPFDLPGPYSFTAGVIQDGKLLTSNTITLEETGLTILPLEGGVAAGLDGYVKVTFPEKAADEALDVRVRAPIPANRPPEYLSGTPFEILAMGQSSGKEIHQFSQPLTITLAYTGTHELSVFYYNPDKADWLPLTTYYDREAGLLVAQTDHLSLFDTDVNDWQAAEMPTVKDAQVAQQTGASTYSYPIWTPPGPGGLQPNLSFEYNGQVVDSSIGSVNQGGWLGMGWTLDTGYIERDMRSTLDSSADDTFNLVLGGVSSRILRDNSTPSHYYLANEKFWKIDLTGDTWTVWDKEGTKYTFGKDDASRARYPQYQCSGNPNYNSVAWRFMLAEVEDKFHNKLTYTYTKDTKQVLNKCNGVSHEPADLAIYPSTITYPNSRYIVEFVIDINETPKRADYNDKWWSDDHYRVFFNRYRLKRVFIKHDADGTGPGAASTVRTYEVSYGATLFPNYYWHMGGQTFSISSIQETGSDGTTKRPATTFQYDEMHLTNVSNGYGGGVSFTYESTPWAEVTTFDDYATLIDITNCPGAWTGNISCNAGKLFVNGTAYYTFLNVHPGGVYHLRVDLKNLQTSGSRTGWAKLQYGDNSSTDVIVVIPSQSIPAGAVVSGDMTVTLPKTAKMLKYVVYGGGGGLRINRAELWLDPTRYRVTGRTLTDSSPGGQTYAYTYEYDDAATNDAEHSAAVAGHVGGQDDLYQDAYSDYRGNAMSREIGPLGSDGNRLVSTTWYQQDDRLKGAASVTMAGTQSYRQQFNSTLWSDYSSEWAYNGAQPVFERVSGDIAAKIQNTAADWSRGLYRSNLALTDGKSTLVQFRLGDSVVQTIQALASGTIGSNYYRWGVKVINGNLYIHRCTGNDTTGCSDDPTPQLTGLQANTWYVLQLTIDDVSGNVRFLMRVWERENPGKSALYEQLLTGMTGRSWRFLEKTYSGTVWLDEYSEGNIYTLSVDEPKSDPTGYTLYSNLAGFRDLAFLWTRPITETNMTFEGDSTWVGTRIVYDYIAADQGGVQYGNLTQQVESSWTGSSWLKYRATKTQYYPYSSSSVYLVGLPARTSQYSCPSGVCGMGEGDLLARSINLYDNLTENDTDYTDPPTQGVLTNQRTLLRKSPSAAYTDVKTTYDTWGNPNSVTSYTGEGNDSALATTGAKTINSCYGTGSAPTCNDDGYHTYKAWEQNAVYATYWTYKKEFGMAESEDGPNDNDTVTATYDTFSRLLKVIRPGDNSDNPTISIAYNDDDAGGGITLPFYTQAEQLIEGSTKLIVRKFYNGLGQLIQAQTAGAIVNGSARDIIVDTTYDAYGNVYTRSIPYDVSMGSGYRTPTTQPKTTTVYDILSRPLSVTAPDNTLTARYTYLDLETQVKDAKDHITRNLVDVWGRTVEVHAPLDPWTRYLYDVSDQLTNAQIRSGAGDGTLQMETTLGYDLAGRKTSMVDPDMGSWSYTYDALGNLFTQTGASGCTTTLGYDAINRLTTKTYTGPGACDSTPDVSYTYDQGTYGMGRRTRMDYGSGFYTTWQYDARGRMTQESKAISGSGAFVTQYTYNSADLPLTMRYPADASGNLGETVTFAYHSQMLLNSVIGSDTYVKSTSYDALGRVDVRELGLSGSSPVLKNDYDYFPWTSQGQGGRLQYLKTGTPGSPTSLQSFEYNYDAVGNVNWIVDYNATGGAQTQTFHYDNLDRLVDAAASGGSGGTYPVEYYTYNPDTGNLASKAGIAYGYNDTSHKHAVTHLAGVQKYWYGANGNMYSRIVGATTYSLTYDAENRLISVSGGGLSASFTYDGDGNRVKGVVGSLTTTYIGNYFEWTGNTDTMKRYYYAGSVRVAMKIGGSPDQNPVLNWLFGDHLGSTSRAANANGTALTEGELRYKAWGEKRFPAGSSTVPTTYRYTGQRQEVQLGGLDGLYYYGARWYDPYLSRFIQPDTIVPNPGDPRALDRFAYVLNNPLKFIDPNGHDAWWCETNACQAAHYAQMGYGKSNNSPILTKEGRNMWTMFLAWKKENREVTLIDYLKLTLSFEFSPLEDFDGDTIRLNRLLAHTATHLMYWYCAYQSGCASDTGLSDNAILNFVGISGSMRMRFDQFHGTGIVNFNQESAPEIAEDVVALMLNPDPEWKTGGYEANGHPKTWGNAQYPWWPDPAKVKFFSLAPDGFNTSIQNHSITFKFGNFAVLTADEVDYWKSDPK